MSGKWWTNHEMRRLQENYPFRTKQEILEMFPGRTFNGIYWMVKKLKLKKRRKRKLPKARKPKQYYGLRSNAQWMAICAQHKPVIFGFQNTAGLQ